MHWSSHWDACELYSHIDTVIIALNVYFIKYYRLCQLNRLSNDPVDVIYNVFFIMFTWNYNFRNRKVADLLFLIRNFIAGDTILYSKMVMEIMGGWKNTCADARFRHRHLFRNRKETKEKTTAGLFMGQFKVIFREMPSSSWNWIFKLNGIFQMDYNFRYHNWWAYRYYVCELLALLNVVGKFKYRHLFLLQMVNSISKTI